MRAEDIKIGMKVIPVKKSAGSSFETWGGKNKKFFDENGYLYVTNVDYEGDVWLNQNEITKTGDLFKPEDLIPYKDKKERVHLKDLYDGIRVIYHRVEDGKVVEEVHGFITDKDYVSCTGRHYSNSNWTFVSDSKFWDGCTSGIFNLDKIYYLETKTKTENETIKILDRTCEDLNENLYLVIGDKKHLFELEDGSMFVGKVLNFTITTRVVVATEDGLQIFRNTDIVRMKPVK